MMAAAAKKIFVFHCSKNVLPRAHATQKTVPRCRNKALFSLLKTILPFRISLRVQGLRFQGKPEEALSV